MLNSGQWKWMILLFYSWNYLRYFVSITFYRHIVKDQLLAVLKMVTINRWKAFENVRRIQLVLVSVYNSRIQLIFEKQIQTCGSPGKGSWCTVRACSSPRDRNTRHGRNIVLKGRKKEYHKQTSWILVQVTCPFFMRLQSSAHTQSCKSHGTTI